MLTLTLLVTEVQSAALTVRGGAKDLSKVSCNGSAHSRKNSDERSTGSAGTTSIGTRKCQVGIASRSVARAEIERHDLKFMSGCWLWVFLSHRKKNRDFFNAASTRKNCILCLKQKNTKSKLNYKNAPMAQYVDDVMSEDASCDENDSVGSLVDFIADDDSDMSDTEDDACVVDDVDRRSEIDQLRADLRPDEVLEEDATDAPNTNNGARRSRRRSVQPRRFLEEYAEDISRVLLEDIPPDEIDAAIHDDISVTGDDDDEEYDEDQDDDDDVDDDDDDVDDDDDDDDDVDDVDDGEDQDNDDDEEYDEDQDDDDEEDQDVDEQFQNNPDGVEFNAAVTTADVETTTATDGGATTSTTVPDLKQVHVDVDGAMTLAARVVQTSPSTLSANLQWTREVQAQFEEVFPSRGKDATIVFSTPFSHPFKTNLPAMDESITLELSLM